MLFGSKGRRTSWRAGGRAHGDLLHLQGQAYRRSRTRGAAAHRYTRNTCGNAFLIYAYNNTGGGSGLLLCVREIKAEAAHAVQGVVCVLLHKGKHTAHGEVTLHGGPLCDVRCVACVVVRCVSCVVENKKSNTKMVYRPALRRRARSGAAPARRRATPLCKKTRGGEINT